MINVFSVLSNLKINNLKEIVDYIKNDYIYINSSFDIYKYNNKLWYDNPIYSRTYTFKMQSLLPISYLLAYYHEKDDDESLEKALQLFYLWYEENFENSKSELVYHKQAVAMRLIVTCDLFSLCKNLDLCILDEIFEEVIVGHCEMLCDEVNYKIKHNYLIDQDIALYVASTININYFEGNSNLNYIELAKKRLRQNLDYLICDDTSFLGQSIQYAYHLYIRLTDFYLFLLDNETDEQFIKYLKQKMENLLIFIYAFLEPFGYLPPIGESSYIQIDYDIISRVKSPLLEYIKSLCDNDLEKELLYNNAYFKKANYFISVIKNNDDFLKLIFTSSFHSIIHKHFDDLSFTLYYKKYLLFLDGGKYNYQSENYFRKALISAYSHNTICVDKHDYLINQDCINKSGITNVVIEDDFVYAVSFSCLYENVLIKRNILLLNNKYLLIIDDIDSKKNHQYEIIFNLNPIIKLKTKNKQYYGFIHNEVIFTFKNIFSNIKLQRKYYFGNKNEYKGLYSKKINEIENCHCLIYSGNGDKALIVTEINLSGEKIETEIKASQSKIKIKIGEVIYTIMNEKYYNLLFKNNKILQNHKNKNNTLIKAINYFYNQNNFS